MFTLYSIKCRTEAKLCTSKSYIDQCSILFLPWFYDYVVKLCGHLIFIFSYLDFIL